ncbi:MAG TPA: formate dehydrogenase accessory sulfurtransferase FdhD, partial [Thermoanaerobaculia bacterium]
MRHSGKTRVRVWRVGHGGGEERPDHVATEEPLEVRLVQEGRTRTVAVTMRTPGNDDELALGFLFAEGVLAHCGQVRRVGPCVAPAGVTAAGCENIVEVELAASVPEPELAGLDRHFFSTSACGVCGKAGLDALRLRVSGAISPGPQISAAVIAALPARLREAQGLFASTGGLHAAALFDAEGRRLAARED